MLKKRQVAEMIPAQGQSAVASTIEPLESRLLMAGVKISGVSADNRGEIVISLNGAVDGTTVNKNSVQAYTAGTDKIMGTADDTRVPASVRYSPSTHRITVEAQVTHDVGYRVKLVATRLRDATLTPIDGEFTGAFPTGDGHAGGNFEFQSKNDRTSTPTARISSSEGVITIKLYRALKPVSVANFLSYANDGAYDGMFISRSISGFIEQGGSVAVNSSNSIFATEVKPTIVNEYTTNQVIHNTAFTVAFAKLGGDPNSASNQFFFNINDNSTNLDNQNGGFTVFATAANSASEAVLTAIAAKQTIQLSGSYPSTDTSQVPVNSTYDGSTMNPLQDLVLFRRVSLLVKVAPLS